MAPNWAPVCSSCHAPGGAGNAQHLAEAFTEGHADAAIIAGMGDNGGVTQRSLQTINDMVLTETEAGARFHMTKYLGDHLADFPEGKRTLQILALKDPSSRIRTHARSVLRQHKEE